MKILGHFNLQRIAEYDSAEPTKHQEVLETLFDTLQHDSEYAEIVTKRTRTNHRREID